MQNNTVIEIESTQDYLIYQDIENIDFIDHYQLSTKNLKYAPEPKDLMIAFFKSFPTFFRTLLHTREFFAKFLKLKTAPKSEKDARIEKLHLFKGETGDSIALFDVLDKTEKELLTGQNDTHLDFRLSFITYKYNDSINLELATTVNIHNKIGKLYFSIVQPIHKFYMKKILKKMEFVLSNKSWE